jgi:hypothetical protein
VDQNSNNSPNDFLWTLLENPANDANSYAYQLHRLVNDFPQSGVLQALLAHASDEKNLKRASAYFSPRALFKLINAPSTLTGVPDERIIIQPGIGTNGSYARRQQPADEENYNTYTGEELVVDKSAPPVEAAEETVDRQETDELVVDHNAAEYLTHAPSEEEHYIEPATGELNIPEIEHQSESNVVAEEEAIHEVEAPAADQPIEEVSVEAEHHPEAEFPEPEIKEYLPEAEQIVDESPAGHEEAQPQSEPLHAIAEAPGEIAAERSHHDDEGQQFVHEPDHSSHEEQAEPVIEAFAEPEHPEQTLELTDDVEEPVPVMDLYEEQLVEPIAEMPVHEEIKPEPEIAADEVAEEIYDEIVGIEDINLGQQPSGRYFTFDQEFGAHDDAEEKSQTPEAPAQSETEQQDVSKYHDEKMPYTFMWWLDKTRKEHAQIYQPYVKPPGAPNKKAKKITDELQQQYFENIFHITSVDELDKSAPRPQVAPDLKRKEQIIIERFIKEEPQIKPQSSDKLDNENKAKKSSEDRDELVSETLAAIYSDQMLYHKAIASYKKLMLKFPEKSRYFAEKIEQLEKKTN